MKSIDELLCEVAKNLNVQPPNPQPKKAAEPVYINNEIKQVQSPSKCKGMNLDIAKKLASAVEIAAKEIGVSVVTAVVNEGANLVCLEAMDNSYIASIKASQDKAYTAAALKMPTSKALEESRDGALDGLTNGNGLLLLAGGEPLFVNGILMGGIGVSGGTKEQDAFLAKVAVRVFDLLD